MSRERPRSHIPGFFDGSDWTVRKSRATWPVPYVHGQELEPWTGTEIDGDPEMGARNRSGERRRTGRRLKQMR